MDLDLKKPDLLSNELWAAVEQHHARFVAAVSRDDPAWAIGSAKELVECIARVAGQANGVMTPSNADFNEVVADAHRALSRQAGLGITGASDVQAIVDHARKMVLNVNKIRNEWGTGHGRAEQKSVSDEMLALVVGGTMLWARWALVRLDHLLLSAPGTLMDELLHGHVSRRQLQKQMAALALQDQPEEVQHALGVAFGQRSANGTFVAREVGIDGPAEFDDLVTWPAPYRLGAAEGLAFSSAGYLGLKAGWVPTVVQIVLPLPPSQIKRFARELAEKVSQAGVSQSISGEELSELVDAIDAETGRMPISAHTEWRRLVEIVRMAASTRLLI